MFNPNISNRDYVLLQNKTEAQIIDQLEERVDKLILDNEILGEQVIYAQELVNKVIGEIKPHLSTRYRYRKDMTKTIDSIKDIINDSMFEN